MFYIDLTNESPTRYDPSRFLQFDPSAVHDPLGAAFFDLVKDLPMSGTYTIVLEAGRPDLLSYAIYKDTQYWWLLLHFNGIVYTNQLTIGSTIKYFALDDLEDLFLTLKQRALGRTESSS